MVQSFIAVVMDCWLSFNHFRSSKLPKSHPHVAVHASVRASGIEKERSCPTAGATSPVLVDRDRRRWSIYQKKGPRWVGPHGPALASLGQQALALTKVWNSGGDHPEFRLHRHSTLVLAELWDPAGLTMDAARRLRAGIARMRFSALCKKVQKRGQLAPLFSSPVLQVENTRATCRGVVDKTIPSPGVRKRIDGKIWH